MIAPKTIWTLYCHTHIESGRRYIGMTSQTMLQRWNQHVSKSINSKGGRWHFPNAIRKYGKDAFAHEVLAQSWTLEGANATEEELILQYDTRNPEKGFNLAKGGEHKPHGIRKNPWDDPEYRQKCVNAARFTFSRPEVLLKSVIARQDPAYIERKAAINREILSRPAVREKTIRSFAGKQHGEETKRRIAASPTRHRQIGPILQAVKSKISESVRSSYQRKYDSEDRTEPTFKTCSKHGELPIGSFYRYQVDYGCGPRLRYLCKQCQIDRSSRRWASRKAYD